MTVGNLAALTTWTFIPAAAGRKAVLSKNDITPPAHLQDAHYLSVEFTKQDMTGSKYSEIKNQARYAIIGTSNGSLLAYHLHLDENGDL